jgi:hypothetical protein
MGSKVSASGVHWVHLPEADGQPGLTLEWPVDGQQAIDAAVQRVERWFEEERRPPLWGALFLGRSEHEGEFRRIAYEAAFLWRLQQRLAITATG